MRDREAVAERLGEIRSRIDAVCRRCARDPSEVVLVGASKRQPLERLMAAYEAGLRVFGENRVQEAEEKKSHMPADVEWHLLGPLQSNKIRRAVEQIDVFHALDRIKIARGLERIVGETSGEGRGSRVVRCFAEVNLGEEPTKHGFSPHGLADTLEPLATLRHVELVGLMAIPPPSRSDEEARSWFRKLRELRDELARRREWQGFPGLLSMGMSDDFEVAIEEGATHVRLGTALFGPRSA